jgi:predicted metal-binding protein
MPDVVKMEKEFNALLKKYESASYVREMDNAARNVNLTENLNARKIELEGFRKRFDLAKNA